MTSDEADAPIIRGTFINLSVVMMTRADGSTIDIFLAEVTCLFAVRSATSSPARRLIHPKGAENYFTGG